MELKTLGEFNFIHSIESDTIYDNKTVVQGIGDDCAIYKASEGYDQLISTDTMVEGVEIVSYRMLPEHAKTAMSIVAAADYNVFYKDKGNCPFTLDELKGKVKAFYEDAPEILVTKKTKKSEKVMDLKQLVYDFQVEEADGCPFFYLKVSTGSVDNVKPELLLEAFYRYLELPYNEMQFQIHRVDVYARKEDGTLIALDEMGDDILE